MRYTIFFKSSKAICPKCGGITYQVYSDDIVLQCMDCHTYYRAIGPGQAEAELEFEEVKISGTNNNNN